SMADGRDPATGLTHQGDALSAVQSSRSMRQGGRNVRRPSRHYRLFRDVDAVSRRQSRQLYAALLGDPGERQAARFSLRLPLGRSIDAAVQSIYLHALDFVRLLQSHSSHQLDHEWPARALSQARRAVDRKRTCLGAVPDAAARFRIHDALVGGAAVEAAPERIHCRNVFYEPTARTLQSQAY